MWKRSFITSDRLSSYIKKRRNISKQTFFKYAESFCDVYERSLEYVPRQASVKKGRLLKNGESLKKTKWLFLLTILTFYLNRRTACKQLWKAGIVISKPSAVDKGNLDIRHPKHLFKIHVHSFKPLLLKYSYFIFLRSGFWGLNLL